MSESRVGTSRRGIWMLATALVVVIIGVAALLADPVGEPSSISCSTTVPGDEVFVPPAPWPETPSAGDMVWFGSDELWTVIDRSGHIPRKSVWWSASFPGGAVEERPELEVTYRRLDTEAENVVFEAPGTNAYTPEDGDFMINGIEPSDAGCWQATATYKGASLSYIYEVE